MPKVSVIVPVYGVEKYIERCARSLFGQTLDDIEFIFVDDNTKDGSLKVLDRVIKDYPGRQHQISILHHIYNKGLPQARRTGVLAAQGEYVANCDSDDWVDSHYYETMYIMAISDNSDIVVSDFYRTNGIDSFKCSIGAHSTNIKRYTKNLFFQKDSWAVWNKIFKKELYKDIVYPFGSQAEDMAFTLQMLKKSNRISYVNNAYYYYYLNMSSITKVHTIEKTLEKYNAMACNINILRTLYSDKKYKYPMGYLDFLHKSGLQRNIKYPEVRNLFRFKMSDILYLFDLRIKIKVKMAYIYCLLSKRRYHIKDKSIL